MRRINGAWRVELNQEVAVGLFLRGYVPFVQTTVTAYILLTLLARGILQGTAPAFIQL